MTWRSKGKARHSKGNAWPEGSKKVIVNFRCSRDGINSCTISIEIPEISTLDSPEERILAYDGLAQIIGEDAIHYCTIASNE